MQDTWDALLGINETGIHSFQQAQDATKQASAWKSCRVHSVNISLCSLFQEMIRTSWSPRPPDRPRPPTGGADSIPSRTTSSDHRDSTGERCKVGRLNDRKKCGRVEKKNIHQWPFAGTCVPFWPYSYVGIFGKGVKTIESSHSLDLNSSDVKLVKLANF